MQWTTLAASVIPLLWSVQLVPQIRLARRLRKVGVEVAGRIIRQREVNDRNGRHLVPTIGFTTQTGQPIEGESRGNARNLRFCDRDEVRLSYDPARPSCFLLAQELTSTRPYWWLAVAGVALTISVIVACQ